MPLLIKDLDADQMKKMAKNLKKKLQEKGTALPLNEVQTLLAQAVGHKDWNEFARLQPILPKTRKVAQAWDKLIKKVQTSSAQEVENFCVEHWAALSSDPLLFQWRVQWSELCTTPSLQHLRYQFYPSTPVSAPLWNEVTQLNTTNDLNAWAQNNIALDCVYSPSGQPLSAYFLDTQRYDLFAHCARHSLRVYDTHTLKALPSSQFTWLCAQFKIHRAPLETIKEWTTVLLSGARTELIEALVANDVFDHMMENKTAHYWDIMSTAMVGNHFKLCADGTKDFEEEHWCEFLGKLANTTAPTLWQRILPKEHADRSLRASVIWLIDTAIGRSTQIDAGVFRLVCDANDPSVLQYYIDHTPNWEQALSAAFKQKMFSSWQSDPLFRLTRIDQRLEYIQKLKDNGFNFRETFAEPSIGNPTGQVTKPLITRLITMLSDEMPDNSKRLDVLQYLLQHNPEQILWHEDLGFMSTSALVKLCQHKESAPLKIALKAMLELPNTPQKIAELVHGCSAYLARNNFPRSGKTDVPIGKLKWDPEVIALFVKAGVRNGLVAPSGKIFEWGNHVECASSFEAVTQVVPVSLNSSHIIAWLKRHHQQQQSKGFVYSWIVYEEMLQIFSEHGGDINALDEHGNGVLHTAVKCNLKKVVPLLLQHGALVDCVDTHGLRPKDYADNASLAGMVLLPPKKKI